MEPDHSGYVDTFMEFEKKKKKDKTFETHRMNFLKENYQAMQLLVNMELCFLFYGQQGIVIK